VTYWNKLYVIDSLRPRCNPESATADEGSAFRQETGAHVPRLQSYNFIALELADHEKYFKYPRGMLGKIASAWDRIHGWPPACACLNLKGIKNKKKTCRKIHRLITEQIASRKTMETGDGRAVEYIEV